MVANDADVELDFLHSDLLQTIRDKLLKQRKDSTDLTSFGDELECLHTKNAKSLLELLHYVSKTSVVDIDECAEDVYLVVKVLNVFVDRDICIGEFADILILIHDNFLQFSDNNLYIQNCCSQLLEKCWVKGLPSKDRYAVNISSYLLARIFCPLGKIDDVERLNTIKESLELVDFQCESCISLLSLLCNVCTAQVILKSPQGLEFLSYILTLNSKVMSLIHDTLKLVLPDLKDQQLAKLGEVYFKSIQMASDKNLSEDYEKSCLQDLMMCALYSQRQAPDKIAQQFLKVLTVIHKQKKDPALEDKFFSLYKPLLWRALDVANGLVRANAAALFVLLFPVISSTSNKVQVQEALEEQCSKIMELLKDNHEEVRECAVLGASQIVEDLWSTLPSYHLTTFVTTLCVEMTHDISSANVVVAALRGVKLILNNSQSHLVLSKVLPCLSNHIYHPSQAVRDAMISLLQTVHQISILSFWDIVPAEDLLTIILESKSRHIKEQIVRLLCPIYIPESESLSVQTMVTLDLLRQFPESDIQRVFYSAAYPIVGTSAALKLVVGLLCLLKECTEKGSVVLSEETKLYLSSDETPRIVQVLEVCGVLVHKAAEDLKVNSKAAKTLVSKITPVVGSLLLHYKTDCQCLEALSIIIVSLPKEGLVQFKKPCYNLCRDPGIPVNVKVVAGQILIRMGGGYKLLELWSKIIGKKLESVLQVNVARPDKNSVNEDWTTKDVKTLLTTISSTIETDDFKALLECPECDTLYATLFSVTQIIPVIVTKSCRQDINSLVVNCLRLAARFSLHVGGDMCDAMCDVSFCVLNVFQNSKSGDHLRNIIGKEVLPVLVEGYLVLHHSPDLVTFLFRIFSLFQSSELARHRLPLCKYIYRTAYFLGNHVNKDVDVRMLVVRVLESVLELGNGKGLGDVKCLLLELGVLFSKQSVVERSKKPLDGLFVDILEVLMKAIRGTTDDSLGSQPMVQTVKHCLIQSEAFSSQLVPLLETRSTENPDVQRLMCVLVS